MAKREGQRRVKRRISKRESDKLAPTLKKFNGLAKQFADLLGIQIEQKKSRINVMVSQTAKPQPQGNHAINIVNMDVSKSFIKGQKNQGSSGSSPFRSPWSKRLSNDKPRGTII